MKGEPWKEARRHVSLSARFFYQIFEQLNQSINIQGLYYFQGE